MVERLMARVLCRGAGRLPDTGHRGALYTWEWPSWHTTRRRGSASTRIGCRSGHAHAADGCGCDAVKSITARPQYISGHYVLHDVAIDRVDHVWSADITYIRLRQGFVYLVAIIDWYSRYVLAWEVSVTLDSSFCLSALERALRVTQPDDLQYGPRRPVHEPGLYRQVVG